MNMKKIFIILFCVLGMATSCNFLDVIPSGKATEDDLFKTHVQADNFAASLYYYMPNRWYFQSSLEMCGGGDMVSSFYGSVYYFKWKSLVFNNQETPSNTYVAMWSTTCDKASGAVSYNVWGGIRNAYLLLENIDKVPDASEDERNRWRGEAYWNIAYMHQTLLEYYGPIVIVDHLIGLQEDINYERKPYLECVQFISDMYDKAAEYLPASYSSNFLGRATKTTAKALKSRLWLQAASPMVNGNAEWYAGFKNNDGTPLMPLEYDKELWKKAMDAAKDAIQQGEADGFQLYAPSKETDTFEKGYENYRAAFLGGDANAFYNEYEHLFCYAAQGNISYNIKNMAPRTGYSSYSREDGVDISCRRSRPWSASFPRTVSRWRSILRPRRRSRILPSWLKLRATRERRPPSSTSTGSQDSTHQSVTTVDHTTSTARPLCSSAAVGKSSRTMETPVMNIKAAQAITSRSGSTSPTTSTTPPRRSPTTNSHSRTSVSRSLIWISWRHTYSITARSTERP